MEELRKMLFNGSFYFKTASANKSFIEDSLKKADIKAEDAKAYVVPHAGYIYSGSTAAYAYKSLMNNKMLKEVETIVIVGPDHNALGDSISVSMMDWETPFGILNNDRKLSMLIASHSYIEIDERAHMHEHSIEVQLPFLAYIAKDKRYCFISMTDQSLDAAELLSKAIIDSIVKLNRKILLIASSDMNHYESREVTYNKDMEVIKEIEAMNIINFYYKIDRLRSSMCGYGAVATAMLYSRFVNTSGGELLRYYDSGYATKDTDSVVGYAAIAFH
ncbi:MAG: candidate phosphomevalonate decarboxylase [Candidatus Micrarchaeota archaeon]|nr:MAG: candidate phosphomevalonate decarboxylase [Candidatus Micrarchaeota archaeon]